MSVAFRFLCRFGTEPKYIHFFKRKKRVYCNYSEDLRPGTDPSVESGAFRNLQVTDFFSSFFFNFKITSQLYPKEP